MKKKAALSMLKHLSNTDLGEILNDDGRFEEVVNDIKQKIAEKFLSGDAEVDEFLDQFLTRRKIMHLRKVKVDKMRELKRKPKSSTEGYPAVNTFRR
ncbi:vacuolar protein sorting-associated protein 37C-like, partial [Fopius arisanus]|uniref:Vacuolar protein sorting-associated protein 37C-like n=1 Tax=Fopius arisanus TaxID=64838 RepID=A0A9R1U0J3_9HYME